MKYSPPKKSISPVVATALLLVVAVIGVVGFNTWFTSFSSSTLTNIETQNTDTSLSFKKLIGDTLYLNSNSNQILTLLKITDSNQNIKCEIKDNSLSNFKGDTRLLLNFENNTINSTEIQDLSGYKNNGILKGTVNCLNNKCYFNGINDYIDFGNDLSLNIPKTWTFLFWINRSFDYNNYERIFGKSDNLNWDYFMQISPSDKFQSGFYDENSLAKTITSNQNVLLNKKIMLVSTFDGKNIKLYIDGILDSVSADFSSSIPINSTRKFTIGKLLNDFKFRGEIYGVGIYSKALNNEKIKLIYDNKKVKFYEQLLSKGINKIDVSSCNLTKSKVYDILGSTKNSIISKKLFVR